MLAHMTTSSEHVLYIGPANAREVLGLEWRRARDIAIRLGVRRVRCGRAALIPAAELRAAIERDRQHAESTPPGDGRAAALAALGRTG